MVSIWGHRGASGHAPENTLAAFERALSGGADGFELDVQRTRDGALVVCHDETVDRTSNGKGAIVDMALDELRALDFGDGQQLPLLVEVLELLRQGDAEVNIELKNCPEPYPGMEAEVVQLVHSMHLDERAWLSSFNHLSLRELTRMELGGIRLGVLYCEPLVDAWDYARRLGAQAIHPDFRVLLLEPGCVERSHDAGVRVHPWTVNVDDDLAAMFRIEVDAVITNFPGRARELLGE